MKLLCKGMPCIGEHGHTAGQTHPVHLQAQVDGLSEIKEDAVENLNLIVKLAEQIAELDNQAYDVFTKKRVGNRKKNKKFKKTKSRKENRRYSFEDEEYEDSESDGSRVKA